MTKETRGCENDRSEAYYCNEGDKRRKRIARNIIVECTEGEYGEKTKEIRKALRSEENRTTGSYSNGEDDASMRVDKYIEVECTERAQGDVRDKENMKSVK